MQLCGRRSWQNRWAESCELREDTEVATVRAQLTLGTELLPLATGQSFIEGEMFITQGCSEFLVLGSVVGKKKGCCCIYFVLVLVLCWLGTNVLCCAKCSLQRATHLDLLLNIFSLPVFYFRACGGGLLWFCTALHRLSYSSPCKGSEKPFLNPFCTDMIFLMGIIV